MNLLEKINSVGVMLQGSPVVFVNCWNKKIGPVSGRMPLTEQYKVDKISHRLAGYSKGIYVVTDHNDKIVYIGQSGDCHKRLLTHIYAWRSLDKSTSDKMKVQILDTFHYFQIIRLNENKKEPCRYFEIIEAQLLNHFKPERNKKLHKNRL